jgi:phosphoglycerate dehydrogenase-like enzyme
MTVPDGGGRGDVARILVTEPVDEAGLRLLEAEHEVVRRPGCTPEELLALIPEFDALIVRSATQVTAEVLRAARRLQVVGRAGVGVNNIDVETATQRGIVVVNVPDGNTIAATEQTFALLLAVARRLPDAVQSLREGRWEREAFVGTELRGKTMGIVGLGRIGQEVVRSLPLDDVLRAADVLTVHTPLTPETRGMIGARELALLPPGAIVLNCARGGIVDERALYEALTSGHLGGAGLDVFEREPATDNPLVRLPNVVATPHLGASTREAQSVSAIEVAKYVRAVLAGEPVPTAVNLPGLSQRDWEVVRPLVPLGELLGRLYRQGLGGQLGQVEVVTGPLPARGGDWVASAVLKGCLAGLVDDVVNLVNAQRVAAAHGVKVVHSQSTEVPERALTVRVHAGGRTRVVAGHALADGSLRVTNLDGMPIEMAPMRHMLLTRHRDRPGLIGAVGTVLGQAGVNIAAMLVGRQAVRGDAVMVLAVDDPVEPEVLARLRTIPGMEAVRSVVLPDHLLPPEPVVRGVAS